MHRGFKKEMPTKYGSSRKAPVCYDARSLPACTTAEDSGERFENPQKGSISTHIESDDLNGKETGRISDIITEQQKKIFGDSFLSSTWA